MTTKQRATCWLAMDYGIIILRSVEDENGDELFESIDDEDQLNDVYEHFMVLLFDDEDEEEGKE